MVGWTKEEDETLRRAFDTVKPTPRFWIDVAKLLHGKSAHDCFDRFYSLDSTPLKSKHKSRAKIMKYPSQEQDSVVLEADGEDLFYALEPDVKFPSSVLQPSNEKKEEQELLQICSGVSSPALEKSPSTFGNSSSTNPPNPPAKKALKEKSPHEKYIEKLLRRNASRATSKRRKKNTTENQVQEESKAQNQVKEARKALMSTAREAIDKFQQSQAFVGSDYGFHDYDDDKVFAVDSSDEDADGDY